jgi:hypothetical protein
MALGSKANFNYNPSDEEIKAEFMKSKVTIVKRNQAAPLDLIPKEKKEAIRAALI